MPLKTYKKTQIMRLSCLALADACVEWGVAWPDNEDDLVIRGELFKAIRASIAPTEPSEVCEGEGEGKGNVWAEDFCVHIRISSASRPDLAQNHQPKPFFFVVQVLLLLLQRLYQLPASHLQTKLAAASIALKSCLG